MPKVSSCSLLRFVLIGVAQKLILEELQKQNRPFNHTLLHATLHGAVTKTQCQSLLDTLADKGKLIRKEFGKAKVYWADQEGLESVPPEKLKELDKEIEGKKQTIKELTSTLAAVSSGKLLSGSRFCFYLHI